jgi:hypothetical protein
MTNFVVNDTETLADGFSLTENGDTLLVTASGSIIAAELLSAAIVTNSDLNQWITVDGSVYGLYGVDLNSSSSSVSVNGLVSGISAGVEVQGNNNQLVNSGTIQSSGSSGVDVEEVGWQFLQQQRNHLGQLGGDL